MTIPRLVSRITSVVVYASAAIVTRRAELPAGLPAELPAEAAERVAISGLPLCLEDASLRIRVEGTGVMVIDTAVALDAPVPAGESDAATPAPAQDADLLAAQHAEATAKAELATLQTALALVKDVQLKPRADSPRGTPPAAIPVAARGELLDTVAAEQERLQTAAAEATEVLRRASAARATVEARIAAATTARQARSEELRKSAVATLRRAAGAGPVVLLVEYRVPGARWLPSYVVRFPAGSAGSDQAEIQMRAMVRQRSGEDWSDASISVCSADALGWQPLPVLASSRIGRRQSPPANGWRRPPSGTEALFADYDHALQGQRRARPLDVPAEVIGQLPAHLAHQFRVVPLRLAGKTLVVGTADPNSLPVVTALEFALKRPVIGESLGEGIVAATLLRYYPDSQQSQGVVWGTAPAAAGMAQAEEDAGGDESTLEDGLMYAMSAGAAPPPEPEPLSRGSVAPGAGDSRRSLRSPKFAGIAPGMSRRVASAPAPAAAAPVVTPPSPDDLDPAAWLAYGSLRMADSDDAGRGRLHRMPSQGAYLALLAEARVTIRFSVTAILDAATVQARDTAGDPPGTGWQHLDAAFACTWTAAIPATVPADGGWHVIPLGAAPVAVTSTYVCVPREAREVFRVASVANPFPTPLPGGPVDCYLGDRYLLTTPLSGIAAGGRMELGLGVEQAIRVARNVEYAERGAGVFGGTTRAEHHVRLTVRNQLPTTVRVEVRERLPVSDLPDCVITADRVEPPWQEWHPPERELPGGHRWLIDVAAGAQREVALDYTITFPAKHELAGGNRREA